MKPSPGDRVRITQNAWGNSIGPLFLEATAGSIARALSYTEYCDYINTYGTGGHVYPRYVKEWMEKGEQFPFVLLEVAPLSQELRESTNNYIDLCTIGRAIILGVRFFEVIGKK